ncbi:hypothetical protein KFZ76_08315 [Methylovulum psychrotolerans]|uniref:hypothetical protein n=1 Tax=Methylovulum psychrotolerans TaxID=1704499 RepID=UPI001BFEEF54|nr:hypothetical protein [Methylovulum psychrotolerans]MBT9097708.1 hypothetical protein [Methylovulum psychrotolerans]
MFDDKPRHGRKPIDACISVVCLVIQLLRVKFPEFNNTSNDELLKCFFFDLFENRGINGVNAEASYLEVAEEKQDITLLEYYVLECLVACAYAVDGVMAYRHGHKEEAWQLIAEAQYWAGVLYGKTSANYSTVSDKKQIQEKASAKCHEENRYMKQLALDYYKENHGSFKNKDDAALHISKTISGGAFSTVRGWLKGVKPE